MTTARLGAVTGLRRGPKKFNPLLALGRSSLSIFFENRVGQGKVAWDALADPDTMDNALVNPSLGRSQLAEVAYLDFMIQRLGDRYRYRERDVLDVEKLLEKEELDRSVSISQLRAKDVGMTASTVGRAERDIRTDKPARGVMID